jgi:GntR family transcriptional regulator / MocR family aminotransferase
MAIIISTIFCSNNYAMTKKPSNNLIKVSKLESKPIHLQIYYRFKLAIEEGILKDGDRVPASRVLARELSVARGTVENAYSILLGEGIFIAKGQSGTFINTPYSVKKLNQNRPYLSSSNNTNQALKLTSNQLTGPSHVFLPGSPAYDAFPRKIWSRIGSKSLRSFSIDDMSNKDPQGYEPLRQSIATYLRLSRGVVCEPGQVFITMGYQGALDFICKTLKLQGEEIWMEDPGYLFATNLLNHFGAKVVRVPVDEEGLIVSEGILKAKHAKIAIVTPSHHSPLGMAMSYTRRTQLLEWAGSNNAWIVEDDYDGEYRYSGYPLPSLKSLDQYDRVIYAGSFSKTLFPSLKLGYIVLPNNLVNLFVEMAKVYQIGNSISAQIITNDFLAEGHFSKHINKMRTLYGSRRELTCQCLTEVLGDLIEVNSQNNGMHLVANIMSNQSDEVIKNAFNELGYNIHALSNWTSDKRRNGLIIGFTNIPNRKIAIEAAIKLKSCFELDL